MRVESADAAATQPHAMVNGEGEVFYPDGPQDAAWFAEEHGAWHMHADFQWPPAEESKAPPRAPAYESAATQPQYLRIGGGRRL